MSSTTPEVLLLAKHTKLMSNQFVISIYQNKPIWSKAVAENELSATGFLCKFNAK